MPVEINFLDDGLGIELMSTGVVTGKEVVDAYKKIHNPELLKGIRYEIVDRSQCTEYRISAEVVEIIAQQNREISKINEGIIILFVMPTDLQYGVTRIWQIFSEASGFRSLIFRDRESADDYIAEMFQLTTTRKAAGLDFGP